MMTRDNDHLSHEVQEMLTDYSNILYTSSTCVQEFIQLCHIGKVFKDKHDHRNAEDILPWLNDAGVEIIYTTKQHLQTMAAMPALHKDPYDRLIIAQAISDQIALISSDNEFPSYQQFGLNFVYNKR